MECSGMQIKQGKCIHDFSFMKRKKNELRDKALMKLAYRNEPKL